MITLNQLTAELRAEYKEHDVEVFKWPYSDAGVRFKKDGKCVVIFVPEGMLSMMQTPDVLSYIRKIRCRIVAEEDLRSNA